MTEFYNDLTETEITELISQKMEIYGDDYGYERCDCVWTGDKYECRYYMKYHNLSKDNYTMYQYMGVSEGRTLYRFFNVIKNE